MAGKRKMMYRASLAKKVLRRMPCKGTRNMNVRSHRKTYWQAYTACMAQCPAYKCSPGELGDVNKDCSINFSSSIPPKSSPFGSHPSSFGHVFWHGVHIAVTFVTCAGRKKSHCTSQRTPERQSGALEAVKQQENAMCNVCKPFGQQSTKHK